MSSELGWYIPLFKNIVMELFAWLTLVSMSCLSEVTFVPVSKVNGQAEAEDIVAAVRPTTCLVTIMLANNETGVIMVSWPFFSRRSQGGQCLTWVFPHVCTRPVLFSVLDSVA